MPGGAFIVPLCLFWLLLAGMPASLNGSVLFQENFNAYTSGATPGNPPWLFGMVGTSDNEMSNTVNSNYQLSMKSVSGSIPTTYAQVLASGSPEWDDYIYVADIMRGNAYVNVGIMGRMTDYNSTYRVWFQADSGGLNSGTLKLERVYNKGAVMTLDSIRIDMTYNAWYQFEIGFSGADLHAVVRKDGSIIAELSAVDSYFSSGSAGLFRNGGGELLADNLIVSTIPESSAASLFFLALPVALMALMARKLREGGWGLPLVSWRRAGTKASLVLVLASAVSLPLHAAGQTLFSASFEEQEDGELACPPWERDGTEGNPEAIRIADRELRITSRRSNPTAVIGETEWRDYRYQVNLKRNNLYSAAGIIGHYKARNRCFRLIFIPSRAWDRSGTLQLQKLDGSLEIVTEEPLTMEPGQWYCFAFEFSNGGITGIVSRDEEEVVRLQSPLPVGSLYSGKIGLCGAWSSDFSATGLIVTSRD